MDGMGRGEAAASVVEEEDDDDRRGAATGSRFRPGNLVRDRRHGPPLRISNGHPNSAQLVRLHQTNAETSLLALVHYSSPPIVGSAALQSRSAACPRDNRRVAQAQTWRVAPGPSQPRRHHHQEGQPPGFHDFKNGTMPKPRRRIQARHIRRRLASITPEDSLHQLQSPLFSKLPPELRCIVFELAISPREKDIAALPNYYPVRLRFYKRHDLNLLLTCRRIYYETSSIALPKASFFMKNLSGAMLRPAYTEFSRFTAKNLAELNHVQFLDGLLDGDTQKKLFNLPQFRPKAITIIAWLWVTCDQPRGLVDDNSAMLPSSTSYFHVVSFARAFPSSLQKLTVRISPIQPTPSQVSATLRQVGPQYVNLTDHRRLSTIGNRLKWSTYPFDWVVEAEKKAKTTLTRGYMDFTFTHTPGIPDWKEGDYGEFAVGHFPASRPSISNSRPLPADLVDFFGRATLSDCGEYFEMPCDSGRAR